MLLRKFDFTDKNAESKFQFNRADHVATWENYYNCYNYVLKNIFHKGFQRNYDFDCRARPILFMIRHSFELCIKLNLDTFDKQTFNNHNLIGLLSSLIKVKNVPNEFRDVINKINLDTDGACFRYFRNKETGKAFFSYQDKIELAGILKSYDAIPTNNEFRKDEICEKFNYEDRRLKWDLTLHLGECLNLHHIRTQYDDLIEYIVEGVLYENYDVKLVYLPLLFLIRHSLELALKANLLQAQKISPEKVPNEKYENIHSLAKLYNCFAGESGYLSNLDLDKLSEDTKKQFDYYKKEYESLNRAIHLLDSNSRIFRYPIDKEGSANKLYITTKGIYQILKLYYLTDPFVTFTMDVLEEEGIK
jgi:hypothetical protein